MVKFVIRRERCKACGLCVANCPKHLLKEGAELNELGYRAVVQEDGDKCTGCGLCAAMCPDVCFDIYKVSDTAREAVS